MANTAGVAWTRAELSRYLRRHAQAELYDESGDAAVGTAIYTLSDPRDIRRVRYVGQTGNPSRRFLQHLNTARLWLPDETPWWVRAPKLRALYQWIRTLFIEEQRLPTMVIATWEQTVSQARTAERTRIYECLRQQLPLLNVEAGILDRQLPLL